MPAGVAGLPEYADVEAAAERLAGVAHRTPVLSSRSLNDLLGAQVSFKCENLQRVGAFKFRGAWNTISQLSDEQRETGLLAFSSGNHAQAVALVAKLLGCRATIVMPDNAPRAKRAATEGYGAEVIGYDPHATSRDAATLDLLGQREFTLVPPFDHPHIIAGQGTAALELLEERPDLDVLLAPCGGGGLLSGCGLAASGAAPACEVFGVEPQVANDAALSFASGELHTVTNPPTIADGVRTPSLGEINFAVIRHHVAGFHTVPEELIGAAVKLLYQRLKLVVEPSGALGLAAMLHDPPAFAGRRIGIVISGGNVDPETYCELLG